MIRYDTKLNNEIKRIVRNYNAKISRVSKSGKEAYIPEKFDKEALDSLKKSVSNRQDLRRRLKDLEDYTRKGGEKYTSYKGTRIPTSQLKTIKRYQSLAARRINAKIKFYEQEKPLSVGKEQVQTFAEAEDRDYLNTLAKKQLLLNKELEKLSAEERAKFIELLQANTRTRDAKTWQENYLEIFLDTGYVYGVDTKVIDNIRDKIKELKPSEFSRLFNKEKLISQVLFYYKEFLDIGIDQAYKASEEEVVSIFNALNDNLDDILKEYK